MTPEFEWDAEKANENLKKHAVGFEEALTVFADPLARVFDDPDHSENERRELIIGHSANHRFGRELHGAGAEDANYWRQGSDGA